MGHVPVIYVPFRGLWELDLNGNGKWDGCRVDKCLGPFGQPGDLPVAGDWNATGTANIGVFRPNTGEWLLDLNGNGKWDGCNVDGASFAEKDHFHEKDI